MKLNAKEKAEELYVGYWYLTNDSRIAKECAKTAIDEIIKVVSLTDSGYGEETTIQYWEEVKTEICDL